MPRLTVAQMNAHCGELVRLNKRFAPIIKASPLCPIGRTKRTQTHFECMVDSIVSQQVATKAAQTVYNRIQTAAGGELLPETLAQLGERRLYECGLNSAKVKALQGLADAALSGEVDFNRIARLPDDAVIEQLTKLYGIGRWTAEMFLIFQLGRIDVWPIGDLAVRRGWDMLHKNTEPISVKALEAHGESLRPIRSIAAWYCWRAS